MRRKTKNQFRFVADVGNVAVVCNKDPAVTRLTVIADAEVFDPKLFAMAVAEVVIAVAAKPVPSIV